MSEQHDYDGIKYRDEKSSPGIFRLLFTVLVIWGVLYMGYYLFSGWSSQAEADTARKVIAEKKHAAHRAVEGMVDIHDAGSGHKMEGYIAAGKQQYAKLCAACHGENAKGTVGPDLTASKYKYGKSRQEIAKSISEGRPGGMPAFSSQIDHEQTEALVEFLLSLK
jgi:cytochrome c oxidase cbb3-type subunit 3